MAEGTATAAAMACSWPPAELVLRVVDVPVRDFEAKPLGAGDNFATTVLRLRVTTESGDDRHFIVKRLLECDMANRNARMRKTFIVEGHVYAELLPRVDALLRTVGRHEPPIAPRMAHREPEPQPSLFFEDATVEGFRLAGRAGGPSLDVAHASVVLRALARWHAATAVLLSHEPRLFDELDEPLVYEGRPRIVDGALVGSFPRFLRHAESWPDELSRRSVAKLRRLQPGCRERLLRAHRPDPAAFNVAMHGDLWASNILFKYDQDGKPAEVRLIDFQVVAPGPPSSDLHYFFCTADGGEARLCRDELLAEYHSELAACLRGMGAEHVPTLEELTSDLRRRAMAEVMFALGMMPIFTASPSVGMTFSALLNEWDDEDRPHPRDLALAEKPFQEAMRKYFTAWERDGTLDELLQQPCG